MSHVPSRFGLPPLGVASLTGSFTTRHTSHDRDPSPSDAALFKRAPLLDNVASASRAQKLGEKSGKFEFFAAREKNRAAVSQHHPTVPISALRETLQVSPDDYNSDLEPMAMTNASRSASPLPSSVPETTAIGKGTENDVPQGSSKVPEAPDATSIKLGDTDTNPFSIWTVSGDLFINNPPTEDPMTLLQTHQCQPADFDMTSAYKFQQSKLATSAETVSKTRGLPIQDLLAQEPKQCLTVSQPIPKPTASRDSPAGCDPASTKRSYEEAFNQPDQSEEVAIPKLSHSITALYPTYTGKTECRDRTHQEQVKAPTAQTNDVAQDAPFVEEQETPAHEPAVILIRPEDSRPAKRMRMATVAAQVVACVALGGAATFSYLVNTAPVF